MSESITDKGELRTPGLTAFFNVLINESEGLSIHRFPTPIMLEHIGVLVENDVLPTSYMALIPKYETHKHNDINYLLFLLQAKTELEARQFNAIDQESKTERMEQIVDRLHVARLTFTEWIGRHVCKQTLVIQQNRIEIPTIMPVRHRIIADIFPSAESAKFGHANRELL